jgi:hypothetical protein
MSNIGTLITDDQVEDAVIATLRLWLPTYMSEVERQLGLDPAYYQRPPGDASYVVHSDFDKWPEEMLPLVIVVSPGIDDDPPKDGNRRYRASFQIGTICVVSSITQEETRRYAQRMGAALRAALIQKQSLGQAFEGRVRGVTWHGSRNNELQSDSERTIWANRQLFTVEVGDILGGAAGPSTPEPDPNTPPPGGPVDVDTVDLEFNLTH